MVKRIWFVVGVCGVAAIVALAVSIGRYAGNGQGTTAIPGTGVTMALPDGVTITPLGTAFTNSTHDVIVSVMASSASRDLSNNSVDRALYPDHVETFKTSTLNGVLYKRTRAESGGAWDGWWLVVIRGDRALNLRIFYSGSESGKFLDLKKYLSTVSWNDQSFDTEAAFGLRLEVPNLQLVRTGVGALMYNQNGQPSQTTQYMLVTAVPFSLNGNMDKFHQLCEKSGSIISHGQPFFVRYETKKQMSVCDVSTAITLTGQDYIGALMLPDGSIAQVIGHGEPDTFQRALLDAKVIQRALSK